MRSEKSWCVVWGADDTEFIGIGRILACILNKVRSHWRSFGRRKTYLTYFNRITQGWC